MSVSCCRRLAAALAAAAAFALPASAQPTTAAAGPRVPVPSALDAPLFYQLLIAEMELRAGQAGTAYQLILEAARRTRDETLFRRAVDIALQARAGDQALAATQAWRSTVPRSADAIRLQLQILAALNRLGDVAEPLQALIAVTPEADRATLIAGVPRFLQRAPDAERAAQVLEDVLAPYLPAPATATAARVALARAWLAAKDTRRALALVEQAHRDDPDAVGPALVALELMPHQPAAEAVVTGHLARPSAEPALRLVYARVLTGAQRFGDAVRELEVVTRERPAIAPAWLTLGALQAELRKLPQAEASLTRYLELIDEGTAGDGDADVAGVDAATADDDATANDLGPDDEETRRNAGRVQAWLLLAQVAEQRGDFAAAERWLARVDDPQRALEVLARRASLMARQGQLDAARELIRKAPERDADDARAKLVAEVALLRDSRRWEEARVLLAEAGDRYADDADLLYEQAMMAEKTGRLDEMERLLRRVIELEPSNAHAHNALGYSLADRGLRLAEARQLIVRALELAPGDPFITDSLGWVEYRMGNLPEALRLLRQAYAARPDTEIGAHLGEVLWHSGQREEARRVWREARSRDDANDVLRETLARLKVDL
ncbi:MAG: tetratricopeptide repeat protein [Rubrivivax sp.]|jgi:tetratricopeptide (TPR) repeat protein|nr:tetratricopeptide repeat protein [Rubrivivax sp.]